MRTGLSEPKVVNDVNSMDHDCQVGAVIVATIAVAVGLKGVRDQLRLSVFLAYTERYANIMRDMPFEAREPGSGYRLSARPDKERHQVLSIFREYLNLCSEESWLHDHHKIDHPTWDVWVRGMRDPAHFPCFREAWEVLAPEPACGGRNRR